MEGKLAFAGALGIRKLSRKAPLTWKIRNALRWEFIRGTLGYILAKPFSKLTGCAVLQGSLRIVKIFANGHRMDYGLVGRWKVTEAFCTLMVDQLQAETSVWGDFKYHDSGVGNTGENKTDTDIETTDGEDRVAGTQTETSAMVYKSVGTISYTGTVAIGEHGLFNASTGVTLMDRHTFSDLNCVNGDSVEFTYELTATAEA